MTQEKFMPDGYEVPASENNYTKFRDGETKIRILSKPIIGWEDWKDKKPYRFPMNEKPEHPFSPKQSIKHFWAFVVWNYKMEKIQICEITQKSVMGAIDALTKDPDWGPPFGYDIKVIRKGSGFDDTTYTIVPSNKNKTSEEIEQAYFERPVNLDALFSSEDPFDIKT